MANILIAGGSGLIGSELTKVLTNNGHQVRILTRKPNGPNQFKWSIQEEYIDPEALKDLQVVINLNGANVLEKAWTDKRKDVLRASRIKATQILVNSIIANNTPLEHFINASAIGFYGQQDNKVLTEDEPAGTDFLAVLCRDWEAEAKKLEGHCPVSIGRIGLYLNPAGGVFKILSLVSQFYLASSFGKGKHWQAYTHKELMNSFILGLINGSIPPGIYNITGKEPLTMDDFVKGIAHAHGRRVILPRIPAFVLKAVLGQRANALLASQRVSSAKLQSIIPSPHDSFEEACKSLLSK